MLITRDGKPVEIVSSTPPQLTGANDWHGAFVLPDAPDAGPVAVHAGQPMQPSPHIAGWLGVAISVEFTAPPSIKVKVSAARVVALAGNRAEWEGKADK